MASAGLEPAHLRIYRLIYETACDSQELNLDILRALLDSRSCTAALPDSTRDMLSRGVMLGEGIPGIGCAEQSEASESNG